jgi:hypothetical protein
MGFYKSTAGARLRSTSSLWLNRQGGCYRKTKPRAGFDVACKWKRNYQGWTVDEAWFILTNLGSLPEAIAAYKQRMGIEEMFRDCKTGGYNLEETGLIEDRLIKISLDNNCL